MKDFRPELHGNPPWSLCVKAQRRPALRANEANCRRSAVNEGGTAELFGPFWDEKLFFYFKKSPLVFFEGIKLSRMCTRAIGSHFRNENLRQV